MNAINEQTSKQIAALYAEGQSSTYIAQLFSISVPTVFRHLRKHKVESRSATQAAQRFHFDETYFARIDTHEKAQFLGMIAADGNVASARHVFEITLQRGDEYYLEYMRQQMRYSGPLHRGHNKIFDTPHSRLCITSPLLKTQMIALGIHPKKSLTLAFPTIDQVPEEFVSSFILGYYEGDGGIHAHKGKNGLVSSIKMCVTKEFGDVMQRILKEKVGINATFCLRREYRIKFVNMFSIQISGTHQVKKLCEWMYANAKFTMKRKYDRYLYLLSHFDSAGNRLKEENWTEIARVKCATTHKANGTQPGRAPKIDAYFIHEDGRLIHTHRVGLFAREMNLIKSVMYNMVKGKQKYPHRGWSLATEEQISVARAANSIIEKTYEFGQIPI